MKQIKIISLAILIISILVSPAYAFIHWNSVGTTQFRILPDTSHGDPIHGITYDRPKLLSEDTHFVGLEDTLENTAFPQTDYAVIYEDEFNYLFSMDNNMSKARDEMIVPTYGHADTHTGNKYPLIRCNNLYESASVRVKMVDLRKFKSGIEYIMDCLNEKADWTTRDDRLNALCQRMIDRLNEDLLLEETIWYEDDEELVGAYDGMWVQSSGTVNNRTWIIDDTEGRSHGKLLVQGRGRINSNRYPTPEGMEELGINIGGDGTPIELDDETVQKYIKILTGNSDYSNPTYTHTTYRYYKFYGMVAADTTDYDEDGGDSPEHGDGNYNHEAASSFLIGTNLNDRTTISVYHAYDSAGHLNKDPNETFWYVNDRDEVIREPAPPMGKEYRTLFFESKMGSTPHITTKHIFCDHAEKGCDNCCSRVVDHSVEYYCGHGERGCTNCQTCEETCTTILKDAIYCDIKLKQTDEAEGSESGSAEEYGSFMPYINDLGGTFTAQFAKDPANSHFSLTMSEIAGVSTDPHTNMVPGYGHTMLNKVEQSPEGPLRYEAGPTGAPITNFWYRYGGPISVVGLNNISAAGFAPYDINYRTKLEKESIDAMDKSTCPNLVFNQFFTMSKGGSAGTVDTGSTYPFHWIGAPMKNTPTNAYVCTAIGADYNLSFHSSPAISDIKYDPNTYEVIGHAQWELDFTQDDYWYYEKVPGGVQSSGEATNAKIDAVDAANKVKERKCNTIMHRLAWCPDDDHLCKASHELLPVSEEDLARIKKLYGFTIISLYPKASCAQYGEYYEIEDQEDYERAGEYQYHDGNVCMPEQTKDNCVTLSSENVRYYGSDETDNHMPDFYGKGRIRTNTLNPITVWDGSGDSVKKIYGFKDTERLVGTGDSDKVRSYTQKNSATLNVWEKQNGGSIIWPYVQTKYVTPKAASSYGDFYVFTGFSGMAQVVTCTYGIAYGNDSSTNEFALANRIGKPAIAIESAWDSHSSTLNGLSKTGILDANGNDINCVVHGGSTVYLKTANSSSDADKITMLFNGYIPVYFRNRGDEEWNTFSDRADNLVYVYDRDVSSFDFSDDADTNYPFDVTGVADAIKNLAHNIEANLSNIRLELYVAPGIYRQGEEVEFMKKATCVSGPDREDRFDGRDLQTAKKYYLSESESDDSEQSSSVKVKLLTDVEGGEGITYYNAFIDLGTKPGAKGSSNTVKLVLSHTKRNGAKYTGTGSRNSYTDLGDYQRDASIGINTLNIKPNGVDTTWDQVNSNIESRLPARWKQLNQQTGFITNLLYALDFNTGGENHNDLTESSYEDESRDLYYWTCTSCGYSLNSYENIACHSCGALRTSGRSALDGSIRHSTMNRYGSYPGLRPSSEAIGGKTTGNDKGWFNEAVNDMGIVEFQLEYSLDFSNIDGDAIQKWLCMNPSLVGNQLNTYDQRNWTDNNNDGSEDSDLRNPGAMKDKIRTARFVTTNYCSWDNYEDALDPDLLGLSGFKYDLYRRLNAPLYGNKNYVGSLLVCDDTIVQSEIATEDEDDTGSSYSRGIHLIDYEDYGNLYHYCNLPIYADFDSVLASKFFYIDNVVN